MKNLKLFSILIIIMTFVFASCTKDHENLEEFVEQNAEANERLSGEYATEKTDVGQSIDNNDMHRNCGTMDNLEHLLSNDPTLEQRMEDIERHTRAFVRNYAENRSSTVISIPVVFHVVHNGDAVGSGENLSCSLIQAQLNQLNDDFRRTNSDADDTWPQAADTEIEFCLAQTDPNGNTTTGINRIHVNTLSGVDTNDCWLKDYINNNIKTSTIWNRDNYLNIWIVFKINRSSDCENVILGYGQFPGGPASSDGIVLQATTVGSHANPNPAGGSYALGRVATHETGHWLNLRHIWGDGPCSDDDLVSDTPDSDQENYGCATGHVSCGSVDMVQNYMDYSDNACMNLFTQGQKARMQALFAPGGARESLLNSPACQQPLEPCSLDPGFTLTLCQTGGGINGENVWHYSADQDNFTHAWYAYRTFDINGGIGDDNIDGPYIHCGMGSTYEFVQPLGPTNGYLIEHRIRGSNCSYVQERKIVVCNVDEGSGGGSCRMAPGKPNRNQHQAISNFAGFSIKELNGNLINARNLYIRYANKINGIYSSDNPKYEDAQTAFAAFWIQGETAFYNSFINGSKMPVDNEFYELLDQALLELSKVITIAEVKGEIKKIRKWLSLGEDKDLKSGLIAIDRAQAEDSTRN